MVCFFVDPIFRYLEDFDQLFSRQEKRRPVRPPREHHETEHDNGPLGQQIILRHILEARCLRRLCYPVDQGVFRTCTRELECQSS